MDDEERGQTMSRARREIEIGVILRGERLVLMFLAYGQCLLGRKSYQYSIPLGHSNTPHCPYTIQKHQS